MYRRASKIENAPGVELPPGKEPISRFVRRRVGGLGVAITLAGILAGCAGDPGGCRAPVGDRSLTPALVAGRDAVVRDWLTWGGTLVRTRHREDATELELVAYPLTDCGRPRIDAPSIGRFIVIIPGYLETADLMPGQPLTATGRLLGIRDGEVSGLPYRFPLLEDPAPRRWSQTGGWRQPARPVLSIGVGAGSGWRGGGVGIRF
jgi:outer membrane lipoprotein